MNKKRNILIIVAIIALVAAIGSTMAAFVASITTQKDVSAAELGIAIVQEMDGSVRGLKDTKGEAEGSAGVQYAGMPGDEVKDQVAVKTDPGSKDSYIRVTINRSWLNPDGSKNFEFDPADIGIVCDNDSWLIKEDPDEPEVIYCYYTKKTGGDTTTANVMDRFTILKDKAATENSNAYAGTSVSITFEADAVQAQAGQKAMLAEWGIKADIDTASGDLLSYEEQ